MADNIVLNLDDAGQVPAAAQLDEYLDMSAGNSEILQEHERSENSSSQPPLPSQPPPQSSQANNLSNQQVDQSLFFERGFLVGTAHLTVPPITVDASFTSPIDFSKAFDQLHSDFINWYFRDIFEVLPSSHQPQWPAEGSSLTLRNLASTRLLKLIAIHEEVAHNALHSQLPFNLLRISASSQGDSSAITRAIKIVQNLRLPSQSNLCIIAFELDLGKNSLRHFLSSKNFPLHPALMRTLFQTLLDVVLFKHSNNEFIRSISVDSIFLLPETTLFLDFHPEQESHNSCEDELSDLGKCFLAIEFVNEGFEYEAIHEAVRDNSSALAQLALKHNCNKHLLTTSKFLEIIPTTGLNLYQVENLVESMLQRTISSVKLAMLCDKTDLFFRHIRNPYEGVLQLSQQTPSGDLLLFKSAVAVHSQDKGSVDILDEETKRVLFSGELIRDQLDHQTINLRRRLPENKCKIEIFHGYIFQATFEAGGKPSGIATLSSSATGEIIATGEVINFIFKQWLTQPKLISEATINSMLQIRSTSTNKEPEGMFNKILPRNVMIRGKSTEILRLSDEYLLDEGMFQKVCSLVDSEILMIDCNLLEPSVLYSISSSTLRSTKYLRLKLDSEEKVRFLIAFLSTESCSSLEWLDLSYSTRLETGDYSINTAINLSKHLIALRGIVLNGCTSNAPTQFIWRLLISLQCKKIEVLHLDDTYIEPSLFLKLYESPNIYNIRTLSLNDTQGLIDQSFLQFAEKMPKFKGLRTLRLRGLLKKNFNKSLFSDSNISAMKKMAAQMYHMTILNTLVLDDCCINDSVLEILSKTSLPCLTRLYLRKQQRITIKGLSAILQSSTLPSLTRINSNCSHAVTLQKNILSTHDIELSLLNCGAIVQAQLADYIRGNVRLRGIRFDGRQLNFEVNDALAQSRGLKRISVLLSDRADVLRFVELLKSLESSRYPTQISEISACFFASKSFLNNEFCGYLNDYSFKFVPLQRPDETPQHLIEQLRLNLRLSVESNAVRDQLISDSLYIHRTPFKEFFAKQENEHRTESNGLLSSSFPANNSSRKPQSIPFFDIRTAKKCLAEIFATTIVEKSSSKQNSRKSSSVIDDQSLGDSTGLPGNISKPEFLSDLSKSLSQVNRMKQVIGLNLSRFIAASEEISLLSFSKTLNSIETLNLANSRIRPSDLLILSDKSRTLHNLKSIDLSNSVFDIIPGVLALILSKQLSSLQEIKLSSENIKPFIKLATSTFSSITVPLTDISNFSKFHSDNKLKVSIETGTSYKKYKPTMDFYIKRKDEIKKKDRDHFSVSTLGEIRAMVNEFTTIYFRKSNRQHDSVSSLLKLLAFQKTIEDKSLIKRRTSTIYQPPDMSGNSSNAAFLDGSGLLEDNDFESYLKICVVGHQASGKEEIVEKFLQTNFLSPDQLRGSAEISEPRQMRKLRDSLNLGVKCYQTEIYKDDFAAVPPLGRSADKKKIQVQIDLIHSNPSFSLLRRLKMRGSDAIAVIKNPNAAEESSESKLLEDESIAFKIYKPVFVAFNAFEPEIINSVGKEEQKYYLQTNKPVTIRTFFSDLAEAALEMKKKKPVVDIEWLSHFNHVLQQCDLSDTEILFDFLRVRNQVEFSAISEFCSNLLTNQSVARSKLTALNWVSNGKNEEDQLNKAVENTKRLRVTIKDTIIDLSANKNSNNNERS